jgi:hypothetical protein
MFFIQLPRTFPALPVDFSVSPSERPFYNNISQMSTTGSRFHVDPLPVSATAAPSSANAADIKPIAPHDSRSASGLLIPPAEESVVIKEEDDSSDDMASAEKASALVDQAPPPGSCTFTPPAFDILDTREDHVSDKFMNSGQLGTMRFWKSGRVTMMVGSIEFDVSRGAESNFLQQVLQLHGGHLHDVTVFFQHLRLPGCQHEHPRQEHGRIGAGAAVSPYFQAVTSRVRMLITCDASAAARRAHHFSSCDRGVNGNFFTNNWRPIRHSLRDLIRFLVLLI